MAGNFHNEIVQKISRTYGTLSPGQRKIADFVLKDPAEAACLNNVELAGRCEVSKATATRFARAIGFSSFARFREAQIVSIRSKQSYAQRLSMEMDRDLGSFDVFQSGIEQDLSNLKTTLDCLDEATCCRAVDMILGARRVFAFGAGLSQYVIGVLIHGLEPYCRGNAANIGPMGDANSAVRKIVHCDENDLLISCSMPNYSSDTLEVTELAHSRGASICCITDRATSPLAQFSDVVFYTNVTRKLLPNTVTSAIAITEGIVAAVANRREEGLDVHRTLDARHRS